MGYTKLFHTKGVLSSSSLQLHSVASECEFKQQVESQELHCEGHNPDSKCQEPLAAAVTCWVPEGLSVTRSPTAGNLCQATVDLHVSQTLKGGMTNKMSSIPDIHAM